MTSSILSSLERRRRDAVEGADHVLDRIVRDPRGGIAPVSALLADIGRLRAEIDGDRDRRHDRISSGQRVWLHVLPWLDGLILAWFLVGVLNVDLRAPDTRLAVAVALALLGTVAAAAWTAAVGRSLRRFKSADGSLEWAALDGTARGMLLLTGVAVALLGVLMYVRVSDEVFQATGVDGVGPVVVATVLAVAVVLVNVFVLYLSFADGSRQTTELDRLGRVVGPHLRRRHRLQVRASRLAGRVGAGTEALDRLTAR